LFKNYDLKIKNLLKQVHLFMKGDVIGVGFRMWIKMQAEIIGIKGWVRNKENHVEAVVQGEEGKINTIINLIKRGPPTSHVKNIEISWEIPKEVFETFKIRR